MKPNIKNLLAGAVVVVLLWAVTAFAGGDSTDDLDTSATAANEISSPDETAAGSADADEPASDTDNEPASSAGSAPANESEPPSSAGSDETAGDEPADGAGPSRFSDLPTISPGELPIEAIDTLDLIASGGPYPYSKDDSVFQNREGILPDMPPGHYREYTVETPGENDRGARRIVAGADGALYYTDDHYDSFREIVLRP